MTRQNMRRPVYGRWIRIAAGIIVAVIFVFTLVDRLIMPLYTRQGQERAVPKLVGLSRETAIQEAAAAGFTVVEQPGKLGGGQPEGTVLEQHPFAGAKSKAGRKIRVVPALPAKEDVAPELIGLQARDAQLQCRNTGLICTENDIDLAFSELVGKGFVISQQPAPGTAVTPQAVIKLVVSLGPEPRSFFVPYLMEKPLHDVRVALREAGLRLGKIVRKETDLYPTGTVIAQSIRSGQEVERGTAVDVVVAVPAGRE